jgi:hypothetical protein
MITQSNEYIAVPDTCVPAPMPLCDTLLRLAEDPAFYIPKWSSDIMRELRSTLQRMGYLPAQAERVSNCFAESTCRERRRARGPIRVFAGRKPEALVPLLDRARAGEAADWGRRHDRSDRGPLGTQIFRRCFPPGW